MALCPQNLEEKDLITLITERGRIDFLPSQISQIEWSKDVPFLLLVNGERYRIDHRDLDTIQREMTAESFPASKGTYLLSYFSDDEYEEVTRTPVLAWRIDGAGRTRPTVLGSHDLSGDDFSILFSDGTVEDLDRNCWDSEEAWLKDQRL